MNVDTCTHSWAQDDFLKGIRCADCGTSGWDWARAENRRLEDLVKWHEQHRPEESLAQWKRMYDGRGDEIAKLKAEVADYKAGADEEARAGDEARESLALADADVETLQGVVAQLTSANERLAEVVEAALNWWRGCLHNHRASEDVANCYTDRTIAIKDAIKAYTNRLDAAVPAASAGEAEG